MDWQDYTTWAIGAAVALLLLRRLWRRLRCKKSGCEHCGATECPLKKNDGKR